MKAVFFDLFETLITEKTRPDARTRAPWHQRWKTDPEKLETWWEANHVGCMIGAYPDIEASFRALCAAVGSPLSAEAITAVVREQCEWKRKVVSTVEPRIVEMIRAVRALGLQVGVLSNALLEEVAAWDACPLSNEVDDVVFSCVVGMMKPQKEIYFLACDRLGVLPQEVFFIGDGGFDELQGAQSAGLVPLQATWYQHQRVEWAFGEELRQVAAVEEVPALLAAMLGRGQTG